MQVTFHKYQGTGNDFIILDNSQWTYTGLSEDQIRLLCDRRFGIGGDGLMMLNPRTGVDFEMKYYNADGREGSMCGNGGRCMVKFAFDRGNKKSKYVFLAADGEHEAELKDYEVCLKMKDVSEIREYQGDLILDTGSPHYIKIVSDLADYNVFEKGMEIRYSPFFARNGINVNFVELKNGEEIMVRTYERGVEDETLSCGTGVTAAAIANSNHSGPNHVKVITRGGTLSVKFERIDEQNFRNIWLCGAAEKVFEGEIEIS